MFVSTHICLLLIVYIIQTYGYMIFFKTSWIEEKKLKKSGRGILDIIEFTSIMSLVFFKSKKEKENPPLKSMDNIVY